jgi:hypothetical protein
MASRTTSKKYSPKRLTARSQTKSPDFDDFDWTKAQAMLRRTPEALKIANEALTDIVMRPSDTIDERERVLFFLGCRLSEKTLTGYTTLDQKHVEDIETLLSTIRQYTDDDGRTRPLNFLMIASPGSGKSHFIKCVGGSLANSNITALTYDLTGLEKNDDLIPPLDEARNQKVLDRIPMLFLDEFDSRSGNIPMLLPLLWDGAISLGPRNLKLGKTVIILAGSSAELQEVVEKSRNMQRDPPLGGYKDPKIIDLLSRINGGMIKIPSLEKPTGKSKSKLGNAGKVCAAIHLLGRRFGKDLKAVPIGLLRFIHQTEFRYGVRSIHHLIDEIPFKKDAVSLQPGDLQLPMDSVKKLSESSLAYHLIQDTADFEAVVDAWEAAKAIDVWLPVYHREDELPQSLFDENAGSIDPQIIREYYELVIRFGEIAAEEK